MSDEVIDLDEAAEFARLSKRMLKRAIERGELKAAMPSRANGYRLLKSNVIAWIDSGCPGCEPDAEDVEAARRRLGSMRKDGDE